MYECTYNYVCRVCLLYVTLQECGCGYIWFYSGHPWGTKFWPLDKGGLYWGFFHKLFIWDLGSCMAVILYCTEVAFIQGWPLRGVPLYTLRHCAAQWNVHLINEPNLRKVFVCQFLFRILLKMKLLLNLVIFKTIQKWSRVFPWRLDYNALKCLSVKLMLQDRLDSSAGPIGLS